MADLDSGLTDSELVESVQRANMSYVADRTALLTTTGVVGRQSVQGDIGTRYTWVADQLVADNGGTELWVGTGRWSAKGLDTVTFEMFGADRTGVLDSSPAIQLAIDSGEVISDGGGIYSMESGVVFPIYNSYSTDIATGCVLRLSRNTTFQIKGDFNAFTMRNMVSMSTCRMNTAVARSDTSAFIKIDSCDKKRNDIFLDDIRMRGATDLPSGVGIFIESAIDEAVLNARVNSCDITHCKNSLYLKTNGNGSDQSYINQNFFNFSSISCPNGIMFDNADTTTEISGNVLNVANQSHVTADAWQTTNIMYLNGSSNVLTMFTWDYTTAIAGTIVLGGANTDDGIADSVSNVVNNNAPVDSYLYVNASAFSLRNTLQGTSDGFSSLMNGIINIPPSPMRLAMNSPFDNFLLQCNEKLDDFTVTQVGGDGKVDWWHYGSKYDTLSDGESSIKVEFTALRRIALLGFVTGWYGDGIAYPAIELVKVWDDDNIETLTLSDIENRAVYSNGGLLFGSMDETQFLKSIEIKFNSPAGFNPSIANIFAVEQNDSNIDLNFASVTTPKFDTKLLSMQRADGSYVNISVDDSNVISATSVV